MPSTLSERLQKLIADNGLTNSSFASKVGVSAATIGYIVGARQSKPGFELLEKIATAFPDVSLDWLVRGEGNWQRGGGSTPPVCWGLLQNERKRYGVLHALHGSLSSDLDTAIAELAKG